MRGSLSTEEGYGPGYGHEMGNVYSPVAGRKYIPLPGELPHVG